MFRKITDKERIRKSEAENKRLYGEQSEIAINVSEREVQEIVQGQQISEMEIQLLELQLGGI